ncbi:MAG: low-complexity tail membrane protein [Synechococcaceae cyanobacterium]|nr:low-complexity tail membrane protein [Synechococcaceae cyanobacterium]
MNAKLPAEPRSEPLLWLQLLGLGALPLEALLLLLLLAGADPGPWPWLERGLAWSLGSLAPTLLLWRRPADVWSLLLISTPLRGRRELQRRLSGLQRGWGLRLALVLGAAGLLPLLAWLDRWSVLARDLALLPEAPRLVALLLAAAVLSLMLWQWQQLLQALWLLSRPAAAVAAAPALTVEEISATRLCLGLPLLLPDVLSGAAAPLRPTSPQPKAGGGDASG